MSNYPDSIISFREKENKSGVVYDETKKTVIFVEDLNACENEVKAIEETLGTNFKKTHTLKMLGDLEKLKVTSEGYVYDHIEKLSLSGSEANVSPPTDYLYDITFNSDMSLVFGVDYYANKIYKGELTSPGDISTLELPIQTYDFSGTTTNCKKLFLSSDGTKLFLLRFDVQKIFSFTLSTAFDLTTAAPTGVDLEISTTDSNIQDFVFNSDGTKLMFIGGTQKKLELYDLSVGFDLSTAVKSASYGDCSGCSLYIYSISLSHDGKVIIFVGSSSYDYQIWTLTTPWDVTTAEFTVNTPSLYSTTDTLYSMYVQSDYKKVMAVSIAKDKIYALDVSDINPEYVFCLPETFTGKYITNAGISFSEAGSYADEETEFDLEKRSISGSTAGEWTSILNTKITVDAKEYDSRDAAIPCVIDSTKNCINSKEQYRVAVTKAASNSIYGATFWIEVETVQEES